VIQQPSANKNPAMLAYGEEGASNPGQNLYVINNTFLNDDSTPVGSVHLGVVHVLDLDEPKARRREEALADDGFAPAAELRARAGEFETWSRFVLEVL